MLQLPLGCSSRNLLGIALAIWLLQAAQAVALVVAVRADYFLVLQQRFLLVRLTL
jgi:hypothetical protein